MKTNYTSSELRQDILALEAKSRRQEELMKNTAGALVESMKPANLIRSAFTSSKTALSTSIKSKSVGKNLLTGAISLAAGFLSKKLFVRGSTNVIKKAVGTMVEVGVAKAVANNADKITSSGIKMIGKVMK